MIGKQGQTYPIEGEEKIGGLSVKYQANNSSDWTTAMKFMLTNLQWLIYMTQLRDIKE